MKRKATPLMMILILISTLNAFWWDPPETKAKKRVMKLEKYALKAPDTEGLRNLGWSLNYRKLTNDIIGSGSVIIPYFNSAILDKNKDWRARFLCVDQVIIVKGIQQTDAKEIISTFLEVLIDSNDNREVRREIANNFYWIGGRSDKMGEKKLPTGHWVNLLSSDDRKQIVQTLIKIGKSTNEDHQVRWNSIRSLSVFSDFELLILNSIKCCIDDPNQHIRAIAINTLGAIANCEKQRIGEILVTVLKTKGNKDLATEQSLFWIKKLKVEEAKPYLLESLVTAKYCLRPQAAEALGELRVSEAIPTLIAILNANKESITASKAIIALGKIGDASAVIPLVEIIKRKGALACNAAGALAQIGDKRAIPSLLALLEDDNANINLKEAAALALIRLDSQAAVPKIEKAIAKGKSVDPRVWENIENILAKYKRGENIDWGKDE